MRDDDPIIAALSRLEAGQARLEAGQARLGTEVSRLGTEVSRLDAEQSRLRTQLNTKMDTILDSLTAVRADTDVTKGHMIYCLQENLTLSQRITKLEDEIRKR